MKVLLRVRLLFCKNINLIGRKEIELIKVVIRENVFFSFSIEGIEELF